MWGATVCGGLDFWGASVCGGLLAILDFGGLVCLSLQSVREGGSFLRLSVGRIKTKYFYGASFVPFSAL